MTYFDRALLKSIELIRIPSVKEAPLSGRVNAPFGENVRRCLDIALSAAAELGFDTVDLEGYCGFADVGDGALFGILGHLDVVPLGEGWSHPQGEIVDGILYGRGAVDDKTPIILCLYATAQLISEGYRPKKRIRILFGCDEESGDWQCMQHYNDTYGRLKDGFSPDADFPVIYAEKGILHVALKLPLDCPALTAIEGGTRINMVADRCTLSLDDAHYSFSGKSAHGSQPDKGDNAILKALSFVSARSRVAARLLSALTATDGSGLGIAMSDEQSGALTLNVGLISLSDGTLTVSLDIRYPVSYTAEHILSLISSAMPEAEVDVLGIQEPLSVDKNGHTIQTLLSAYNSVTGQNALPIAIGGGTYARAMDGGVAFGPEFPDEDNCIHQVDERISLTSLRRAYDIYLRAIAETCFEAPRT